MTKNTHTSNCCFRFVTVFGSTKKTNLHTPSHMKKGESECVFVVKFSHYGRVSVWGKTKNAVLNGNFCNCHWIKPYYCATTLNSKAVQKLIQTALHHYKIIKRNIYEKTSKYLKIIYCQKNLSTFLQNDANFFLIFATKYL